MIIKTAEDGTFVVDGRFTLITAHDYETLESLLRSPPLGKPVLVEFVEANGKVRYIQPPGYRDDGTCHRSAFEQIFDPATRKWFTTPYCDTVAKHVIRVKPANGFEYPFTVYNIKERDLKDDLFLRGLVLDEWEPYLKREKAK